MAMKKIDVLAWGMKHIASNHYYMANVDYEEDGSMCLFGKGGVNVPTLSDVQMMCDDLGIPRDHIEYDDDFGIEVIIDWEWTQEKCEFEDQTDGDYGKLLEDYVPTGMELWKRKDAVIGEA